MFTIACRNTIVMYMLTLYPITILKVNGNYPLLFVVLPSFAFYMLSILDKNKFRTVTSFW